MLIYIVVHIRVVEAEGLENHKREAQPLINRKEKNL